MAYINCQQYGVSSRLTEVARNEIIKEQLRRQPASLGKTLLTGLMGIGGKKDKLEEEKMWYSSLMYILDEIFS